MNKKTIAAFSQIPQPPRSSWGFLDDIRAPLEYHYQPGRGCDAGETSGCLKNGVSIRMERSGNVPETALRSLKTVLKTKDISESDGGYPLIFQKEEAFEHEEFELAVSPDGGVVRAGDEDGFRRGIYLLEEKIREAEGMSVMSGLWRKKPFVKHRISRCFFGPTNRPPYFIDELTDDIDYYPEEYLNKLAHEGVNGLWLTIYLKDYPTSIMPGHGKDAEKRCEKLRRVVEKCLSYGIRIYLFMSEPKLWGEPYFCLPEKDAALHPELVGFHLRQYGFFCTSSKAGKQYFRETVEFLFSSVPGLGGIINIMYGEDNGSCVSSNQIFGGTPENRNCPLCSRKDAGEVYSELAEVIADAMRKYNPDAEYIGWFYAPGQRDGSQQAERLVHFAETFPEDCTFMLNFESGGTTEQLGKKRVVFDYSLAFPGPSDTFRRSAMTAKKSGAKLQVGCSHEDASVPFIPVPENLYDKYSFMSENNVSAVMQCWYFGNYPGLMNRAAGKLSFLPFPESPLEFLEELARPEWRKDAPAVAEAWHEFSMAYRCFPGNIAFEWYGPLHNCIVWPLHLFPVNEPIAPSWILEQFPAVSGDRIGECLGFHHTVEEALALCRKMNVLWRKGLSVLLNLKAFYRNDPPRLADISLAEAIGLQMSSCCSLLEFYSLREDMLYTGTDHLSEMKTIVHTEIDNTERMLALCRKDPRLGYHSEAEGYLFFPEKLEARISLLRELLENDFPLFRSDSGQWAEYTGRAITGKSAKIGELVRMENGTSWRCVRNGERLVFELNGMENRDCTFFLELNRIHPPLGILFHKDGTFSTPGSMCRIPPDFHIERDGGRIRFEVNLSDFRDFLHPGFPLRMNVYGNGFAWVEHNPLPSRLMYGEINWNCAGWLIF